MRKRKAIKTYAFVDASNIIYGARAEGWFIDQKKLFDYLKRKFNVSKAFSIMGKIQEAKRKRHFLESLNNSVTHFE